MNINSTILIITLTLGFCACKTQVFSKNPPPECNELTKAISKSWILDTATSSYKTSSEFLNSLSPNSSQNYYTCLQKLDYKTTKELFGTPSTSTNNSLKYQVDASGTKNTAITFHFDSLSKFSHIVGSLKPVHTH